MVDHLQLNQDELFQLILDSIDNYQEVQQQLSSQVEMLKKFLTIQKSLKLAENQILSQKELIDFVFNELNQQEEYYLNSSITFERKIKLIITILERRKLKDSIKPPKHPFKEFVSQIFFKRRYKFLSEIKMMKQFKHEE